jgi:putative hydrolase of the HAD superfamily
MLARERIRPSAAVLVEDSVVNLKAARSLGLRTVLITRHGVAPAHRSRGAAVGLRISSLHELARRFPR